MVSVLWGMYVCVCVCVCACAVIRSLLGKAHSDIKQNEIALANGKLGRTIMRLQVRNEEGSSCNCGSDAGKKRVWCMRSVCKGSIQCAE